MRNRSPSWVIIGVILLSACVTATPTPTVTAPPPTPTDAPILATPDRPVLPCDSTQLIKELRENLPYYDEMVISQIGTGGDVSMTIWFVDPELDPHAEGADLLAQKSLATRHAVELAQSLVLSEPCILSTFYSLTLLAVDPLYNLWHEGALATAALTLVEPASEEDWVALEGRVNIGFERTVPELDGDPPEAPEGSCTWLEAQDNLESIFARARVNVGFYYTIGEERAVWAQWDIPPVAQTAQQISDHFFDPLPEIDAAVSCLYPHFDSLWMIYVHQNGEAQWIVAVDGDAVRDEDHLVMLNNMEIVYPLSQ